MLFLLNDMIVDVEAPETRLLQRWREMGCGDPRMLRAQDAIHYIQDVFSRNGRAPLEPETAMDIAALVVAKTGANSLILKPTISGGVEPRLSDVPALVLETYRRGADNDYNPVGDAVSKKA